MYIRRNDYKKLSNRFYLTKILVCIIPYKYLIKLGSFQCLILTKYSEYENKETSLVGMLQQITFYMFCQAHTTQFDNK